MDKKIISLVPGGCLQFFDTEVDLGCEVLQRFQSYFEEVVNPTSQDNHNRFEWHIFGLAKEDGGEVFRKKTSGETVPFASYRIDVKDAFRFFEDQWIPVPFLRLSAERWPGDLTQKVEKGPTNWARLQLRKVAPDSLRYTLSIAFDTTVEPRELSRDTYFAISPEDVAENAVFCLASAERDNGWFIKEEWVMKWLEGCLKSYRQKNPRGTLHRAQQHEEPPKLVDIACYLTLLEALERANILPHAHVVDPAFSKPISVELVLDIGNSRMTGLLVETTPQGQTNLNDSYLLQIRDLSQPGELHQVPIESKVEFSEANFGNTQLSARSGRRTPAFVWPSPVRVGPEAARLSPKARGAEGDTGMSSPKRYLWDERVREQQWRNSGRGLDGTLEPPATRGIFMRYVNMEGTPLYYFDSTKSLPKALRDQTRMVAFEARFTKSSLMMFMLSEVIMQALVTIHSPQLRQERTHSNIPRRLKRIILTVPTAMPLAEQRIFKRWTDLAVGMVWRALNWSEYDHNLYPESTDYRTSPEICSSWDEATCTQLVYLYNEIAERYQGDVRLFFDTMGKKRVETGNEKSLRIASIDIGGGTTDLSISTYTTSGTENATPSIKPRLDFRDGFNIAGDDVLLSVIRRHFLHALVQAASNAGITDGRNLIGSLFKDMPGQSLETRRLRGQWMRQVAVPVGLAILEQYENADLTRGNASFAMTLKDLVGHEVFAELSPRVAAYVEEPLQTPGQNASFCLEDFFLSVDLRDVDTTVRQTLGQILTDLGEIIHAYDCDLLLLSGRPSCWPAALAAPLAKIPVQPNRVIAMHQYRVGGWYPFASSLGRIYDPKTTVLAGAFVCALAENGQLPGFAFETANLTPESTARYIGELNQDGQLKHDRIWFAVDAPSSRSEVPVLSLDNPEGTCTVTFNTPMIIGFRQLAAERWTATRFYVLEYAGEEASLRARNKKPYSVTLQYILKEGALVINGPAERQTIEDEGDLRVEEILDATGAAIPCKDLVVRLQTLDGLEGYWMDTGIVDNIA